MRLPRFWFTIRRTMIAVAIVAVGMGVFEARRRWTTVSSAYRTKALYLGLQEGLEEENARTADRAPWFAKASSPDSPETAVTQYRRRAEQYRLLKRKYEQAARCPWLSFEPDPRHQG
jgi:hypothetical protein